MRIKTNSEYAAAARQVGDRREIYRAYILIRIFAFRTMVTV